MTDAHLRSEAEIADLAPYVRQSAIDAVRDAFRKIVLENQDYSAMLDKLLPELQQAPSKRSDALDWLDVELARLSDDDVISFMERLKRVGGHELKLEPETGGSQPNDDPPTVEPQRSPAQPSRHPFWIMPAAMFVLVIVSFGAGRVWSNPIDVDALREELTRELRPIIEGELRAEMQDARDQIFRLTTINEILREAYATMPDSRAPKEWLEMFMRRAEIALEQHRRLSNETSPQSPQTDRRKEKP